MEEKQICPPSNIVKDVRIFRLASIFFNISLACFVLCVIAAFSSFIIPVFYAFVMLFAILLLICLFFLVIITFGLILLVPNNPIRIMLDFIQNSNMEKVAKISQKCFDVVPYFCYIGLAIAVFAIITLIFTKQKGKTSKIVWTSIFAVLMLVSLIVYYALGGQIWQS